MKLFDKVFGKDFIDSVPVCAGIYEFKVEEQTIYVGKAKNLRDRIRQYRNASRKKAHRKMCEIVRRSTELTFRVMESEKKALLLEIEQPNLYVKIVCVLLLAKLLITID